MKRTIAAMLIVTLVAPGLLLAQTNGGEEMSAAESYNLGVMTADDQHNAAGWGVGGFLAGGLFSWLGTGVTVLIASGSKPTPDYMPDDDVDAMSFRAGYQEEARKRNVRSAAIPGVIMSTLWTILVLNAASQ